MVAALAVATRKLMYMLLKEQLLHGNHLEDEISFRHRVLLIASYPLLVSFELFLKVADPILKIIDAWSNRDKNTERELKGNLLFP